MFLMIYIKIKKQIVIGHMTLLQMLQLDIMFTMVKSIFLSDNCFITTKYSLFIKISSSLFWAPFQNLKISLKKKKNHMYETTSSLRW